MLNLPLLALRSRYFNYILNMLSLKAKKARRLDKMAIPQARENTFGRAHGTSSC